MSQQMSELGGKPIKRPLSAQIFFSREYHKFLKETQPNWTTRQVKAQIKRSWKRIQREEQARWKVLGDMDRRRFEHLNRIRKMPENREGALDPQMRLTMLQLTG